MGKKRKSDLQVIEYLHKENGDLRGAVYEAKADAKYWRRLVTVLMEASEERTRLNHRISSDAKAMVEGMLRK